MVDDQTIMKTIGESSGVSPVLLAVEINEGSSFVPEIGELYQDSHKQASRMLPLSMFLDPSHPGSVQTLAQPYFFELLCASPGPEWCV